MSQSSEANVQVIYRYTHGQIIEHSRGVLWRIAEAKGRRLQQADIDDLSMEAYMIALNMFRKRKWKEGCHRKVVNIASKRAYQRFCRAKAVDKVLKPLGTAEENSLKAGESFEFAQWCEETQSLVYGDNTLDRVFLDAIGIQENRPEAELALILSRVSTSEEAREILGLSSGQLHRLKCNIKALLWLWNPELPQDYVGPEGDSLPVPYKAKAFRKMKPKGRPRKKRSRKQAQLGDAITQALAAMREEK